MDAAPMTPSMEDAEMIPSLLALARTNSVAIKATTSSRDNSEPIVSMEMPVETPFSVDPTTTLSAVGSAMTPSMVIQALKTRALLIQALETRAMVIQALETRAW